MAQVQGLVSSLISEGALPIEIAYALVYSAVELGLRVEPDARKVLSTLLGAVALAAQDAVLSEKDDDELPESGGTPADIRRRLS